jgi:hypothetical protein
MEVSATHLNHDVIRTSVVSFRFQPLHLDRDPRLLQRKTRRIFFIKYLWNGGGRGWRKYDSKKAIIYSERFCQCISENLVLDYVYHAMYFFLRTTFRKLALLPSSGKKGRRGGTYS